MIRTRFAPSPTGYLHVGGLRTALYNYLFAKKNNGKFILRIEDTNQTRKVEGAVKNLINSLKWAGIEGDESIETGGDFGPYVQSDRLELYQKHVDILLEKGHAYHCFCTSERLEKLKDAQKSNKDQSGYDRKCRGLSEEEVKSRISAGEPCTVRMKSPLQGQIVIYDTIRGKVSRSRDQLDDQIIMKSDGYPTYHLANVVDDHFMEISHVIRGEEWLPSTPKHKLLYNYFGWKLPKFAHLPLLLNSDRSKLSKRQGDVAVEDYRKRGYLPQALINFLALLGWNPGTEEEFFTLKQLVQKFSLKKVNKAGAVFNIEKLDWMNANYIKKLDTGSLVDCAKDFIPDNIQIDEKKRAQVLSFVQTDLTKFSEIPEKAATFFNEKADYSTPEISQLIRSEKGQKILSSFQKQIRGAAEFDHKIFLKLVKNVQKETAIGGKDLWMTIRAGLTGEMHGREIHLIAEILGKDQCLKRIDDAVEYGSAN